MVVELEVDVVDDDVADAVSEDAPEEARVAVTSSAATDEVAGAVVALLDRVVTVAVLDRVVDAAAADPDTADVVEPSTLEGDAANLPWDQGTSGVAGLNTSVTFRAPDELSAAKLFTDAMRVGGRVASPYCSSRASCCRLVTFTTLLLLGVVGSTVVELPVPPRSSSDPSSSDVSSEGTVESPESSPPVPSSSPSNHIGRMTPVPGSYAKTWLLCSSVDEPSMHSSTVIAAGAAGRGSKVAQYGLSCARTASNMGICSSTLMKDVGEVEVNGWESEESASTSEMGAVTKYSWVLFVPDALSTKVELVELSGVVPLLGAAKTREAIRSPTSEFATWLYVPWIINMVREAPVIHTHHDLDRPRNAVHLTVPS